jgi:DNA modification methylase
MTEVPCVFVEGLTDAQRKAYILADNRLGELAEWDMDLVTSELEMLLDNDFDIDLTGFELPEEQEETEITEDDVPEEVETRCKLGDLWQMGGHRLICGDSTDIAVIDRLMDGVKADMVFTDPPYGMNAVSKSGVLSEHYKADIMNDDDNTVAIDAFNLAREYFKDAKQIWWGANYYTECLPSSECWIVWDKNNGASDQTDCELAWANMRSVVRQFTMASEKTNRVHPTQKPCKLFAEILHKFDKDNSVKNVVDLFGGSGSTLIACEQLNRKCFMCELDPHYCDVIIQRWENLTGQKAALLNE